MTLTQEHQTMIDKHTKNDEAVKLVALAEDLGIKVYQTNDFVDAESGLIVKENGDYVIYINKAHPRTRKRFTIAHEIAHFMLHKNRLDEKKEFVDTVKQPTMIANALHRSKDIQLTEEEKEIEIQANELAAKILMPEERFKKVWEESSCISEVAEKFDVSQTAATMRGINLFQQVMM